MRSQAAQPETIRQYLLGQLSQPELTQFEERLLAESEFYEELLIEEDELVDQYLRGELSVPESKYFESHFLRARERQQKLDFAAALKKYVTFGVASQAQEEATEVDSLAAASQVTNHPAKWRVFSLLHIQSPVVGFALAAAVLVILFGTSWMIVKNWTQPEPHDILTATLAPGLTRSDDPNEVKKITIPPSKDTVRLQMELVADEYQVYRAVLQDAAGTVLLQKDLKAQPLNGRSVVILDVPATKLPANYYQIKLKGITPSGNEENAASYHFTVSR